MWMYLIFFQTKFHKHYLFNEQLIDMFLCLHLSSSKCLEAYFGTNLGICLQCSFYCVSPNCKAVDPSASHHTVKPSLTDFLVSVSAWKLHFSCITSVTCAWQTCLCITLLLLHGAAAAVWVQVSTCAQLVCFFTCEIRNWFTGNIEFWAVDMFMRNGPIYSFRVMFYLTFLNIMNIWSVFSVIILKQ